MGLSGGRWASPGKSQVSWWWSHESPLWVSEAEVSGEKESEGGCSREASEKDKGERMGSEREEEEEGDQKGQKGGGNRHKQKDEDGPPGSKHGRKGEQGGHPETAVLEIQLSLSLLKFSILTSFLANSKKVTLNVHGDDAS